jgi:carbon monoxide dehydrogenase subunit G
MKLEGTADFPYDATDVWKALHDIDILAKAIPGCKSMVASGEADGEYIVALSLGVAAIKGDYEGKVRVTDVEFPHHYTLHGEGAGQPGYINMNVDCRLDSSENGTLLRWSCDAEVGGLIAGIGGRVLTGISKYMAKQFFKALNDEMKNRIDCKRIESAEG